MIETKRESRGIFGILQRGVDTVVRLLGGTSMIKFLIRRLLAAIPVLLAILLVTFTLSHLLPGGPFNAVGQRRMPDYMVEQLREQFGLNKSLVLNTWHDGYCPESEQYMEAAGCYDTYYKELDEYEYDLAQLPAQEAYYQWAKPRYDEAVQEYNEDRRLYEENLKQYEQFTAAEALNAAYTAYREAQAQYEEANAQLRSLSSQGTSANQYRAFVYRLKLAGFQNVVDTATARLDSAKADFRAGYAAFVDKWALEGMVGANADFEAQIESYEAILSDQENYLTEQRAQLEALQGADSPLTAYQAAAEEYFSAKDEYEEYMAAKIQYEAIVGAYEPLKVEFDQAEAVYNEKLDAYNAKQAELEQEVAPVRDAMVQSKNKVQAYEAAKNAYEKAQLDLSKYNNYAAELEAHEAELDQLEAQLQPLQEEVAAAQQALDAASTEEEREAAQTRLAEAQAAYNTAAEPYNKALARYTQYTEAVQRVEETKAEYEALAATYEADLAQYNADLTAYEAKLAEVEQALAPFKAEVDQAEQAMQAAAEKLEPYNGYVAAWNAVSNYVADEAQLQEKEAALAELKAAYEEARAAWDEASVNYPEQPVEPIAPPELVKPEKPAKPVKPQPWSLLPTKRIEKQTLGGGTGQGELTQVKKEVWRIDLLNSQFFNYLWDAAHLDFGPSLNKALRDQNVQVSEEIARRLPVSMQVGVFAVALGFLLGIPLGVLAAVYHNTAVDYVAMFFAVIGQSTPSIVLAPILIIVFAVELGWVPVADQRAMWQKGPQFSLYYLQILALPVITLGVGMSAGIARLTRASLLQVLNEDYVRTARAKGLRERVVIYVHALKNALIPVATIVGPLLAGVLTGTFVVELIYVIPGLGKVFVESVAARDYTMIMGVSLLYSVFLILGNILVDIMYTWLDPRIRFD